VIKNFSSTSEERKILRELQTASGRGRVNINGAVNTNNPSKAITIQGEAISAENTK
jgi:hypothetical protein